MKQKVGGEEAEVAGAAHSLENLAEWGGREGKRAAEAREGLQCVFTTPHPNHCYIRLSLAANYISLPFFFPITMALKLCLVLRKPVGFSASISLHTIASSMLREKSCQSTFLFLSLPMVNASPNYTRFSILGPQPSFTILSLYCHQTQPALQPHGPSTA